MKSHEIICRVFYKMKSVVSYWGKLVLNKFGFYITFELFNCQAILSSFLISAN